MQRASNPKVGQHDPSIRMHEHVGGLDISVNDPTGMGIVERRRHLLDKLHRLGQGQGSLLFEPGRERALGKIGHDEVRQVAGLAKLMDGHNIGVLQGSSGIGLALEASQEELPGLWIAGQFAMDDLDGDIAMRAFLAGEEDGAKAADTQRPFQHTGAYLGVIEAVWIPARAFRAHQLVCAFGTRNNRSGDFDVAPILAMTSLVT